MSFNNRPGGYDMRNLGIVALCVALGGCAAAPKMAWVRTDGQPIRENPVLLQQADLDRTICTGERSKAALSGVTFTGGGIAGAVAAQQRTAGADQVGQGCMAEKGYVLVQEDQVEAKRAELASVAELKKQQEAAAAAPQSKPRKPAAKPAAAPTT
ncbi:hypothetical protein ACVWXO_008009 [Bradyrhizobium sp. LM2.7]